MKKALVTGVTGQDGAYLCKLLLDKGYEVYGTFRRLSTPNFWRLQHTGVLERIKLIPAELTDASSLSEALRIAEPREVYNLAAQSFVGSSFEYPAATANITGVGAVNMLEAIRQINPQIRYYQASTSELYGNNGVVSQNESSPFRPASPYAAAKLLAYWHTAIYRESYNLFACNGILFNHESPIRGLEFISRKITNEVAKIKLGLSHELKLGNLDAKRDWGYAPEYVESMWLMMQQDEPGDYVIATGQTHSVKEFAEKAFLVLGLNWENYVKTDKAFLRPLDVNFLNGDCSKANRMLGWQPKVTFDELVELMVRADYDRWQRWQKGEKFAWDVPSYDGHLNIVTRSLRV